jgi:hypothetical protein
VGIVAFRPYFSGFGSETEVLGGGHDSTSPTLGSLAIDEVAIDAYKQRRTPHASRYGRPLSPASVNRKLANFVSE